MTIPNAAPLNPTHKDAEIARAQLAALTMVLEQIGLKGIIGIDVDGHVGEIKIHLTSERFSRCFPEGPYFEERSAQRSALIRRVMLGGVHVLAYFDLDKDGNIQEGS